MSDSEVAEDIASEIDEDLESGSDNLSPQTNAAKEASYSEDFEGTVEASGRFEAACEKAASSAAAARVGIGGAPGSRAPDSARESCSYSEDFDESKELSSKAPIGNAAAASSVKRPACSIKDDEDEVDESIGSHVGASASASGGFSESTPRRRQLRMAAVEEEKLRHVEESKARARIEERRQQQAQAQGRLSSPSVAPMSTPAGALLSPPAGDGDDQIDESCNFEEETVEDDLDTAVWKQRKAEEDSKAKEAAELRKKQEDELAKKLALEAEERRKREEAEAEQRRVALEKEREETRKRLLEADRLRMKEMEEAEQRRQEEKRQKQLAEEKAAQEAERQRQEEEKQKRLAEEKAAQEAERRRQDERNQKIAEEKAAQEAERRRQEEEKQKQIAEEKAAREAERQGQEEEKQKRIAEEKAAKEGERQRQEEEKRNKIAEENAAQEAERKRQEELKQKKLAEEKIAQEEERQRQEQEEQKKVAEEMAAREAERRRREEENQKHLEQQRALQEETEREEKRKRNEIKDREEEEAERTRRQAAEAQQRRLANEKSNEESNRRMPESERQRQRELSGEETRRRGDQKVEGERSRKDGIEADARRVRDEKTRLEVEQRQRHEEEAAYGERQKRQERMSESERETREVEDEERQFWERRRRDEAKRRELEGERVNSRNSAFDDRSRQSFDKMKVGEEGEMGNTNWNDQDYAANEKWRDASLNDGGSADDRLGGRDRGRYGAAKEDTRWSGWGGGPSAPSLWEGEAWRSCGDGWHTPSAHLGWRSSPQHGDADWGVAVWSSTAPWSAPNGCWGASGWKSSTTNACTEQRAWSGYPQQSAMSPAHWRPQEIACHSVVASGGCYDGWTRAEDLHMKGDADGTGFAGACREADILFGPSGRPAHSSDASLAHARGFYPAPPLPGFDDPYLGGCAQSNPHIGFCPQPSANATLQSRQVETHCLVPPTAPCRVPTNPAHPALTPLLGSALPAALDVAPRVPLTMASASTQTNPQGVLEEIEEDVGVEVELGELSQEDFARRLAQAVATVVGEMMEVKHSISLDTQDFASKVEAQCSVYELLAVDRLARTVNSRPDLLFSERDSGRSLRLHLLCHKLRDFEELRRHVRIFPGTSSLVAVVSAAGGHAVDAVAVFRMGYADACSAVGRCSWRARRPLRHFGEKELCVAVALDPQALSVVSSSSSGLSFEETSLHSLRTSLEYTAASSLLPGGQMASRSGGGAVNGPRLPSRALAPLFHATAPSESAMRAAADLLERADVEAETGVEVLQKLAGWLKTEPESNLSKALLATSGIHTALVAALRRWQKTRDASSYACRVLGWASRQHSANAHSFVQAGATVEVVQVLVIHAADKEIQRHALYAIGCLSHYGGAAAEAVAAGVVGASLRALATHRDSPSVHINGFELLRSLAGYCDSEMPIADLGSAAMQSKLDFPRDVAVHQAADGLLAWVVPKAVAVVSQLLDMQCPDEGVQRSGVVRLGELAGYGGVAWRGYASGAVGRILRAMSAHRKSAALQAVGLWALGRLAERVDAPTAGLLDAADRAMREHADSGLVVKHGQHLRNYLTALAGR